MSMRHNAARSKSIFFIWWMAEVGRASLPDCRRRNIPRSNSRTNSYGALLTESWTVVNGNDGTQPVEAAQAALAIRSAK